jgi:hypothetical protein
MSHIASAMTPRRGSSFPRPNNPRRRRKAAAGRQAADRSTMAVADNLIAMATPHVTS